MKTILSTIAAVAVLGTVAQAGGDIEIAEILEVEQTQTLTGFYAGVGYSNVNVEESVGFSYSADFDAVTLQAGYDFNQYVAVEGRYTNTDLEYSENGENFTNGEIWSVFVKPQYPVTPEVKVYMLAGYGDVEDVDSTFQYGLGAEYTFGTNFGVFADYVIAYDDTIGYAGKKGKDEINGEIGITTIGLNYKF